MSFFHENVFSRSTKPIRTKFGTLFRGRKFDSILALHIDGVSDPNSSFSFQKCFLNLPVRLERNILGSIVTRPTSRLVLRIMDYINGLREKDMMESIR